MGQTIVLSVCIAFEDEEQDLAACIASCADLASEILLLDRSGVAKLPEHAKLRRLEVGPEDRRSARELSQAAAGDWVLLLDADEELSQPLQLKIRGLLEHGRIGEFRGFEIQRRHWVCGRRMRSMNLRPDYPLRLYTREAAGDRDAAHTAPKPLGRLEQPIERRLVRRIDCWLRRRERLYTKAAPAPVSYWRLGVRPPIRFVAEFLGRGGWRDRQAGLIWAGLQASEEFLRVFYSWQNSEAVRRPRSS